MNTKLPYKILYIALYCFGFPVLAIVTLALSIQWNSFGMYGAGAFAPFLFVLVAWILSALIILAVKAINKKLGKEGKGKIRIAAAIVPLILVFGLFLIFEAALPSVLDDATSGTIKYEDVLEDADGMHEELLARVNAFKEKNNLDEKVKYSDKQFQDILNAIFPSMDAAYNSFDPLAITIALEFDDLMEALMNGNMPVPLAATLILETVQNDPMKYNHTLSVPEILALNMSKIETALGALIANINDISGGLNDIVDGILIKKTIDGVSWNIFQILGENLLDPSSDPNSEIVRITEGEEPVVLGASLGYQDMAWLNGLPQMFFIPMYSAKTLLFVYVLAIAVLALLQQLVQNAYCTKFDENIIDFKKLKKS